MPLSHYLAYGLRIASALALPELPPASADEGPPDLRVAFGCVPQGPLTAGVPPSALALGVQRLVLGPDDVRYVGDPVGRFAVRGGAEIVIDRAPGVSDDALRPYVLSRLLGVALIQRGQLVLHGSVVAQDGRALGLLGASGAGKSTLAAALAARGWTVLADEHVVLDPTAAGEPRVLGASGCLKLVDASARAAGLLDGLSQATGSVLSQATGSVERYYRHAAPAAPWATALPLAGLCVLSRGTHESSTRLSPRDAALACIAHSYGAPLLDALGLQEDHFQRCATLVTRLEVHELTRTDDLGRLPGLAERVRRLFARATAPQPDEAVGAPRPLC